jgi:phosphoserine phosphatase
MASMNTEPVREPIPDSLLSRIEQVEEVYRRRSEKEADKKIALFDLDNTLLVGDCGDAVFAQLKINEQKKPLTVDNSLIPFTWTEYQETLKTRGKVEAYSRVVKCMAGIPLETLLETSRQVMHSTLDFLELEGVNVPVPFPHPGMQALLLFLKNLGYLIYIISATNQYTVRAVAEEFFGIPGSRVFGIIPAVYRDPKYGEILANGIDGPVTVVEGKVDVYRENIGTTAPLISGGDSTTDIPMLNLTNTQGLTLWVGEEEEHLEALKAKFIHPGNLYFFKR